MGIIGGFIVPHPPIAVPEIGNGEEKKIQATLDSYNRIAEEIERLQPETIILTSPHSVLYRDYFHVSPGEHAIGDFSGFHAPDIQISVDYDNSFSEYLDTLCNQINFPAGTMGEQDPLLDHGTMVPLYFIKKRYTDFRLVRIGLSGLPLKTHYQFGVILSKTADTLHRKTVFIASGDLAHCQKKDGPYGYRPQGPKYDQQLMQTLKHNTLDDLLDFDETLLEQSMECGHRSFCILAGAMSQKHYHIRVLSHEATFGVGYGFCSIAVNSDKITDENNRSRDAYVALAKKTINTYVTTGGIFHPDQPIMEMEHTQAGAFVSIHEHGLLRGCIGTFLPTKESLTQEIIHNAIAACSQDPRFSPIRPEELDYLDINVDILSPPQPVSSIQELDAKRYGVIVTHGLQRGLLLPDLEGVNTPQEQIAICKQKAGIPQDETNIELERFEVIRHK